MARTIFSSAARTASANSARFRRAADEKGVVVTVDTTAVSGTTPTLVVKLQAYDQLSGKYIDVPGATTATINSTSTVRFAVEPSLTASANVAVSQICPEMFRAVATIGGTTPSFTFSVSAELVK